ncbi:hypothetical protein EVAR_99490_1 [Eumeta japonica]|uniref:Uncharacterized protein n=1 Tax=Eumeta variegata TaxID=151549 RepID=A0A4C1Z0U1_EUMVA|nr:hypothetical protein EVAR_99490_1 [Eumeta japonica]
MCFLSTHQFAIEQAARAASFVGWRPSAAQPAQQCQFPCELPILCYALPRARQSPPTPHTSRVRCQLSTDIKAFYPVNTPPAARA